MRSQNISRRSYRAGILFFGYFTTCHLPSLIVLYFRTRSVSEKTTDRNGKQHDPTSREREILQFIAEGMSTPEIAAALRGSSKTVETDRLNLMKKLELHTVVGLVRYAIRNGIVEP